MVQASSLHRSSQDGWTTQIRSAMMPTRLVCTMVMVLFSPALGTSIDNAHLRLTWDAAHPDQPIVLENKATGGRLSLSTAAPVLEFEGMAAGGPALKASKLNLEQSGSTSSLIIEYPRHRPRFDDHDTADVPRRESGRAPASQAH